jgi:hypothetical protein
MAVSIQVTTGGVARRDCAPHRDYLRLVDCTSRIPDNIWRFQLRADGLADVPTLRAGGPKPAMTSVNFNAGLSKKFDMSAAQRAIQPGVLGRQPLKRRSCHRPECRAPPAVFPGEVARVDFDAGPFRASSIPYRCATAFSMS